jgi:hypothetical protein
MARSKKSTNKGRVIGVDVEAVLREEIDYDRFAWALLQYCRLKIEAQEKDAGEP